MLALAYAGLWLVRIVTREYYVWLPAYIRWELQPAPAFTGTKHLFVLFTDDFEPGLRYDLMSRWEREYPVLAQRHHDSAGRPPQHTWFYPGEQLIPENMQALQRLVRAGYGEVELHWHHADDTEQSARQKLGQIIPAFQSYGFLQTRDGRTRFGFTHGNNGLDNSRGPAFCGVNREIRLLRELGCFAAYDFPAIWNESQPPAVNNIYGVSDDPEPNSQRRILPVAQGSALPGDLLILQGPLRFNLTANVRQLFWHLDDGNIHAVDPATPQRADRWVRAQIHVTGRPDWVFVKVWGHGGSSDADVDNMLGADMDRTLSHLETVYNDGHRYQLHYITAREAYNLVASAAADLQGDPTQYYDREIPPYVAGPAAGGHMLSRKQNRERE